MLPWFEEDEDEVDVVLVWKFVGGGDILLLKVLPDSLVNSFGWWLLKNRSFSPQALFVKVSFDVMVSSSLIWTKKKEKLPSTFSKIIKCYRCKKKLHSNSNKINKYNVFIKKIRISLIKT